MDKIEIKISGIYVSLDELKMDVDAAYHKGLQGKFAFCPETVLGLIEKIEDLIQNPKVIYVQDGVYYEKVGQNEKIKPGAMHTWLSGKLMPITNSDGKTVGSTPSEFNIDRSFYNPI